MKLPHGEALMILFENLSHKSVTEMNRRGSAYRNVEVRLRQETGRTGCPQDVGVRLPDRPPPEELCLTRSLCGGSPLTRLPVPASCAALQRLPFADATAEAETKDEEEAREASIDEKEAGEPLETNVESQNAGCKTAQN